MGRCDFCHETIEGNSSRLPEIAYGDQALQVWIAGELAGPDREAYDTCPRCQQAILRALADAVEVADEA